MKPEHFIYKSDGLYYMQNVPDEPNTIGIPSELYQDYIEPYEQALERAKEEAYIQCPKDGDLFRKVLIAHGMLQEGNMYTINMEEKIEIYTEYINPCVPEKRCLKGKTPLSDREDWCKRNCELAGMERFARISAPKKEEEIEDGWTLSREKMPDVDGFYYVYAFVHEECGNVHPVHIIAECRINQWVKPHVGYQMTYWRKLLHPPIIKSTEDSFEIKRKPL